MNYSHPALRVFGFLFTFNFVVFGWIFFATGSLSDSMVAIEKLLYLG